MREVERARVEAEAEVRPLGAVAVQRVAQDRVAEVRAVQPQLVPPAARRPQEHLARRPAAEAARRDRVALRRRRQWPGAARLALERHPKAARVGRVLADGAARRDVVPRHVAFDDGEVSAAGNVVLARLAARFGARSSSLRSCCGGSWADVF